MYESIYNFIRSSFKSRSIMISVAAILTLLVCYTLPCYADWRKSDIGFAFGEQENLVIGDGRNDGVMRIYSGDGIGASSVGNIYEFTFLNNQWEKISFGEVETLYGTDDLCHITGIDIGTGRNDAVNRVYASGHNVAEFYYVSDSWPGSEIGHDIQWTNDFVLGDARNDGRIRMYVAEHDGIFELTYDNGSWDIMEIGTDGQSMGKLLIIDGRNDSILRLYAATDWDNHVYEYTWSGSTWEVDDCGALGASSFSDMVTGDGRNDGINRIYLATNWGGMYELSYDGYSWNYVVITNSHDIDRVAVGSGRNDGINRVYAGNSIGISEYSYSGTWAKTSLIDSSFGVNGIAVGNGRNDGMNRVYVTGDDNHVYEYSFAMPDPVQPVSPPEEKLVSFCNAECQLAAPVQISGSDAEIRFNYTRAVNALVGIISSDWTDIWWLHEDCSLDKKYALAVRGGECLECTVSLSGIEMNNGFVFWLITESSLLNLDWGNGIYELLFYKINM